MICCIWERNSLTHPSSKSRLHFFANRKKKRYVIQSQRIYPLSSSTDDNFALILKAGPLNSSHVVHVCQSKPGQAEKMMA